MKIAVGSDHRGFHLKSKLVIMLKDAGHEVIDLGTDSNDSVDYTDFGAAVSAVVSKQEVERGILICGTGVGMAITANKFAGVRATTCSDELTAEMCRRHKNVNVLCLSGDMLGEQPIDSMINRWLTTEFEGGRHARRLGKISEIEKTNCQ